MTIRDYKSIPVKNLIKYALNSRTHSSEQIDKIVCSINEFGFTNPLLIDENNGIIAGHGRLQAALVVGMSELPCIILPGLSDAQKAALVIADNKIALDAGWDRDILLGQFQFLKQFDYDLTLTGFGLEELCEFMPEELPEAFCDEDEIPDDVAPITVLGDVWLLGDHRLLCGDSTVATDVDRLMNGQKANFCFTSPPYSDQRDYSGNLELKPDHIAKFISISSSKCDLYAVNLGISRKNNEVIPYWNYYIEEAKSAGLKLLSWNIWDRSGFGYTVGQATAMFTIDHEFIFVFGKDKKELNRTLENKSSGIEKSGSIRQKDGNTTKVKNKTHSHRQLGTVIRLDVNRYVGGDEHAHPATFPVLLPESYIEACTKQNENVYEPFGGSGSTIIACEKTKRKCFMMELSPEYCDVIVKRYENYTGKKAVREAMDGQTKIGKNSSTCSHG